MKKMVKILLTLFLVAAVVYMAGCASKITATENRTQGALEQITPAATSTPAMKTPDQEIQISGLFIEFENGTTEPEVRSILENYNLTANYSIDYNSDICQKGTT